MFNLKKRIIFKFVFLSIFIGLCLSVVYILGHFSKFDRLLYGIENFTANNLRTSPYGIIPILIFTVGSGFAIFIWGNEKGILFSLGGIIIYYFFARIYFEQFNLILPFVAVFLGAIICILRSVGWHVILFDKRDKRARSAFYARQKIKGYTAFISYRREGGADIARLFYAQLQNRGVKTFLDVETLGAEHFDERLLREIENAVNFILILSPESLDRCNNKGDWLLKEISHAISEQKNIIPILLEGFQFPPPSSLSTEISDLPRYNSVIYSHDYFDATMDKLQNFLIPDHKRH